VSTPPRAPLLGVARRGDVWLIDFNPIVGSEQAGKRPAVVVSGDHINRVSRVVLVMSCTTHRLQRGPPWGPWPNAGRWRWSVRTAAA
jgi:hypothetical protein